MATKPRFTGSPLKSCARKLLLPFIRPSVMIPVATHVTLHFWKGFPNYLRQIEQGVPGHRSEGKTVQSLPGFPKRQSTALEALSLGTPFGYLLCRQRYFLSVLAYFCTSVLLSKFTLPATENNHGVPTGFCRRHRVTCDGLEPQPRRPPQVPRLSRISISALRSISLSSSLFLFS